MTEYQQRELVVVGGGPAGMAAAIEASRAGVSVCLIDERPQLGGQIFRQPGHGFRVVNAAKMGRDYATGRELIEATYASGAEVRTDTTVWGIWGNAVSTFSPTSGSRVVEAARILLATGAYDRPVVFPGWTLPGVITAGAAQALVKSQRVAPGRRILLAGSGPLALAFAAQLHRYGANLVLVTEAAPFPSPRNIARLAAAAPGNVRLLRDGLEYATYLKRHRIPFLFERIVVRAEGAEQVERAVIARVDPDWRPIPGTEETLDVDTICLGYGFVPSSELSLLCGCAHSYDEDLGGHLPIRDKWMRTTVPGLLAAGDGSGVTGSLTAVAEGRLAGLAAAIACEKLTPVEAERRAEPILHRLSKLNRFQAALRSIYRVGPGIYELATPDTTVCRCEEVTAAELAGIAAAYGNDPNLLKGLTRAAMGSCQGRSCGRQIAALAALRAGRSVEPIPAFTPRPPAKPVAMGLIAMREADGPLAAEREAADR